jgi:hypothetical protein
MTERLRFPIVGSRMIAQAHARAHRTTDSLTATRRAMAGGTHPVGHQLVNGRAVRATRRLAQFLVEDLALRPPGPRRVVARHADGDGCPAPLRLLLRLHSERDAGPPEQ